MTNLLEQAINCDDGYRAAKIINMPSASKTTTLPTTASRRIGQMTMLCALSSLGIG